MQPDKTMRVGNSEQLKLEFSSADQERLPGPLSAMLRVLPTGKVAVVVRTDPTSPYNWGAYNEKYRHHPVTIRAKALSFLGGGEWPKFTFTQPEDVEWLPDGSVRLTMPADMPLPRRKFQRRPAAPAPEPVQAAPAAGSPVFAGQPTLAAAVEACFGPPPAPDPAPPPPAPALPPEPPLAGLARVLAEARQPFAVSPVQRAVRQLNQLLGKPGCNVQLRVLADGTVAAREVFE